MNIFQLSISTLVFGMTLLLGTTAVIASRFVITTVTSLAKTEVVPENVAAPEARPEQVPIFEDLRNETPPKVEDFDPTGSYSLDTEKVPAVFADIELLTLETREYFQEKETYVNRPIVPSGSLETKRAFKFTKLAVGNRELSFETATVDGVSYQFVGNFPVSVEFIDCEDCVYSGYLQGRLKKMKNGKVIAELNAEFYLNGC